VRAVPQEQQTHTTTRLQDFPKRVVSSFLPAAYPEFATEQASAGALYLAGVVVLVCLLLLPLVYIGCERLAAERRDYIERAVPDVTFQDGRASFEGQQPYVYADEQGGWKRVFIVDTTGETTAVPDDYDLGTLIGESSIVDRVLDQVQERPIPATSEPLSARQLFLDTSERTKWLGFAMIGGWHLFLSLFVVFVVAVLAAAAGFGLSILLKLERLPFSAWFNIAAHAATPLAFSRASLPMAQTVVHWSLLLSGAVLVFVLLLVFGAQACRRAKEAP